MDNGIYTRREFKIVLYEKDGVEPFVIVCNDKCSDCPIVLAGEDAERLILSIAGCLDKVDKEKGS